MWCAGCRSELISTSSSHWWTNFRVGTENGILDWYTVLTGVIALVTLTVHGSLYIAVKTEDDLNGRARKVAQWLWPVQLLLTVAGLIATVGIRPESWKITSITRLGLRFRCWCLERSQ